MTNIIKDFFKILSLVTLCGVICVSCEPDADDLGEQFFIENGLEGERVDYDIIAYNISNNDVIEADNRTLNLARLGAFSEGVFGMQKASYISQVRLSKYAPNFGNNPVLDSAVLYIKPLYLSDSLVSNATSDIAFPNNDGGTTEASQEVKIHPVVKYGNAKINGSDALFTIRIHEVMDFLKSTSEEYMSNHVFNTGVEIGSKQFNGNISSVKINSKGENATTLFETTPSIRIPLDMAFFQNKIINQQGTANLEDPATFIRYFRGIKISVDENDGYLFGFSPNQVEIKLYYKYENDNGDMASSTFELPMGSGNVHIGQYAYNRNNSTVQTQLSSVNEIDGDFKLYLQGMGGPGAMIKIPASVIALLRDKFNTDKIGIIGAKVRVFVDKQTWDNDYPKPESYVFLKNEATELLPEIASLSNVGTFKLIRAFGLNSSPTYYELTVTKTLKEAIEGSVADEDILLKLNIGDFKLNQNAQIASYQDVTTPYAPERVVLIGADSANDKRIKLQVTYALKN